MKNYIRRIIRAIFALVLTPLVFLYVPTFIIIEFLLEEHNSNSACLFYGWLNWVTFGKINKEQNEH